MGDMATFSAVCVLAVLIIEWMHHHEVFLLFTMGGTKDKFGHDIVIGILSARENVAQRRAIRDTWVGYIQDQSELRDKLLVRFIIGSKGCDIPPEFREDSYSCTSVVNTNNTVNMRKEMVAFDSNMISASSAYTGKITSDEGYYGVDFKINYALVVKRLGVYDTGSLDHKPSVTLYDTWRQEPVLSVAFTQDDPGTLKDGYRYKDVEAFLFPKNFEGTIVAGPLSRKAPGIRTQQNCTRTHDARKILSVRLFHRTGKTANFPDETGFPDLPISAGNFIFEIHKPEDVERMLSLRTTAEQLHVEKINEESQDLHDEQQEYGDLLFVNEVDVYRNIPKKLLHFFHWVINSSEANFIIKTDDDCFMNIDAIMAMLNNGYITANGHSWWGSFRTNWPLDVLGKWAEHEYPSLVYPAFACGSGNLLSRDLVQWLAQNSRYLHSYQGEDVSVGIWLASILPTYVNDRRWQCDGTCHRDAFVLPEQSLQNLRSAWQNWVRCQNPCSCD